MQKKRDNTIMINTEHFTLSEFTKSKVAKDNNINNFLPLELEENAKFTLESLEKIRQAYGKPIYITSGYRCQELNKLVGGKPNSQHLKAQAVDLKWDENLYNLIKDRFVFDQLIKENGWIHLSFSKNPRKQVIE